MTISGNQQGKKLSIWCLSTVCALSPGLFTLVQAARYTDTAGYFAEKYINTLSDDGVIAAEADGKFKPTEAVTRAQLSDWMVKALGLERQTVPDRPSFSDVKPGDWYFRAVELIVRNNYIAAYPDGFRPLQNIQRGEMIGIIARGLDQPLPDEATTSRALSRFADRDQIPDWARAGIAQAELAGLLTDNERVSVNATAVATRGETAAIMARLYDTRSDRAVNKAINNNGAYTPSPVPTQTETFNSQPQFQAPVQQNQPQYGQAPLSGRVVVVGAGTQFQASLRNSLDSGATQVGEPVEATLASPLYANGQEVVPAGSRVIGAVTSVISARRFRFGANGKIDIKFNSIETPDGRKFPLSASINDSQLRLTGGSTAGRVGKGLLTTGIGAGGGAALGTGLGAIVGSMSGGQVGRATGMGAVFGTAIGSGVGLVGAGVRKGSEVILKAGTPLPVQLDESMQVTTGGGYQPPPPQNQYQQGGGYANPNNPY